MIRPRHEGLLLQRGGPGLLHMEGAGRRRGDRTGRRRPGQPRPAITSAFAAGPNPAQIGRCRRAPTMTAPAPRLGSPKT